MTTTKQAKWIVASIAIVALAAIEIVAISQGINGTMMMFIAAAIAGIAGYKVQK